MNYSTYESNKAKEEVAMGLSLIPSNTKEAHIGKAK